MQEVELHDVWAAQVHAAPDGRAHAPALRQAGMIPCIICDNKVAPMQNVTEAMKCENVTKQSCTSTHAGIVHQCVTKSLNDGYGSKIRPVRQQNDGGKHKRLLTATTAVQIKLGWSNACS